jgi:hypothetical protein
VEHETTTPRAYRQQRFAQEFFVDCDVYGAYLRAGYKAKTRRSQEDAIARLITNDNTQRYLAEEFARRQARLAVQQDGTGNRLKIVRKCSHDAVCPLARNA